VSEQHDGGRSSHESRGRHRGLRTVLTIVVACAVVFGGATSLRAILTRSSRHATTPSPAATCTAPDIPPSAIAVDHLGGWHYDVTAEGTFGSVVVASPSVMYAIQACGAEETELRIIRFDSSRPVTVSASLGHFAFLTSSLVLSEGALFFGGARLDLSGPSTAPPYELTVYLVNPVTLKVVGSRSLGRGYGLALISTSVGEAGGRAASVVASTGRALIRVDPDALGIHTIASFGRSVAQHMAGEAGSPYVAVSLLTPGATPPAETAGIELLDLASGRVVSSVGLPSGSDPESLVLGPGGLWASIGSGLSTEVRRYSVPGLSPYGSGSAADVVTSLQAITLSETPGASGSGKSPGTAATLWMEGLTLLACAQGSTGKVLAATTLGGTPPPSATEIVAAGSSTYAITQAAIGTLTAPAACRTGD